MLPKEKQYHLYLYSLFFIAANAIAMYFEWYYLAMVPFVLLMVVFSLFALDKILIIIFTLIPLSVPLREFYPSTPIDFYIPTEPLIFGLLIIFILKMLIEKRFDPRILKHPISILIYIYLGWIFITALTSTMPIVSLKFFLVRVWFIAAFYFVATQVFRNYNRIKLFPMLYAVPMLIVIGYAIYRHQAISIFDKNAAHYVMNPFYTDHTSYGAALAMFLPVLLGLVTKGNYPQNRRLFFWILIGIFVIATLLSYTRAAWLSLIAVAMIWLVIKLKIKPIYLLGAGFITLTILVFTWSDIMLKLSQNKQDSSQDIGEHLQSMSNIQTDASNLERLNRWNSAFRMFAEKPVFGWGPGTYMFQYASFQMSYEKTIISTNAGDMGNAHSEYIGPLAESGVLGMLTFAAIIFTALFYGFRLYYRLKTPEAKMLALSMTLGLTTYALHGFLNNFLDTDKIAGPFWIFIASIVALETYHIDRKQISESENQTESK